MTPHPFSAEAVEAAAKDRFESNWGSGTWRATTDEVRTAHCAEVGRILTAAYNQSVDEGNARDGFGQFSKRGEWFVTYGEPREYDFHVTIIKRPTP